MTIALRRATLADAPLLRQWDAQPHVIAAKSDEDWEWESELGRAEEWRAQYIAEREGRPIGFVQLFDAASEPTLYWGDVPEGTMAIDIWIGVPTELGQGHGSEMMRQILARAFAMPDTHCVVVDPLASNVRAQRFYQRLGFRPVERRRFGELDCVVHILARAEWEARAVRSS